MVTPVGSSKKKCVPIAAALNVTCCRPSPESEARNMAAGWSTTSGATGLEGAAANTPDAKRASAMVVLLSMVGYCSCDDALPDRWPRRRATNVHLRARRRRPDEVRIHGHDREGDRRSWHPRRALRVSLHGAEEEASGSTACVAGRVPRGRKGDR